MADRPRPRQEDVRIYERVEPRGEVLEWDVVFEQGYFRQYARTSVAYRDVRGWARVRSVEVWITSNEGYEWRRWPIE